jgi:hypothetical protein
MQPMLTLLLLPAVALAVKLPAGGLEDDLVPSGCCDWPSCYDSRTELCLDTCHNTWAQCPRKLFLMSCYSEYMSPFGALPVQCFPDAAPYLDEIEEKGLTGSPQLVAVPFACRLIDFVTSMLPAGS